MVLCTGYSGRHFRPGKGIMTADSKQYVVVVNPKGGTGQGVAVLHQVEPLLAAAGAEVTVCLTTASGHARQIAATVPLEHCAGFCVIGGDGTLHEVVNGLMQRPGPRPPIGVIPGGTGNSVARHFGVAGPLDAVQRILAGTTRPLDVLRVTMPAAVAHCVNIVGWGAVTDINRAAERLRFLGPPRYALAALWQLLRQPARPARLTLDGETRPGRFVLIAGCNTQFTGKGMRLAPAAEPDDGWLDVVVVGHVSRWRMLQVLFRVFNGTHTALPWVESHRVRAFAIAGVGGLNLDGELRGTAPVAVELQPGALRILA